MEGIDNIATSITVKSHGNLTMKDSTGESEPTEWSHYLPRSYQELGYQESADTVGIRVSIGGITIAKTKEEPAELII